MKERKIIITIITNEDGEPINSKIDCIDVQGFELLGLLRYWEKRIWQSIGENSTSDEGSEQTP